jgi:hypothetical protein
MYPNAAGSAVRSPISSQEPAHERLHRRNRIRRPGYCRLPLGDGQPRALRGRQSQVVETLRAGRIHIFEPGLEDLVRRNTAEGRLTLPTV